MAKQHSNLQQYKQACEIARDHGMYVIDKGETFLLYRKTPTRPAYLGKCSSTASLYQKVNRCVTSH